MFSVGMGRIHRACQRRRPWQDNPVRSQQRYKAVRRMCRVADRKDLGAAFHDMIVPPSHP